MAHYGIYENSAVPLSISFCAWGSVPGHIYCHTSPVQKVAHRFSCTESHIYENRNKKGLLTHWDFHGIKPGFFLEGAYTPITDKVSGLIEMPFYKRIFKLRKI